MRIAEVLPAGIHPHSGVVTMIESLALALSERSHDVEIWELTPTRAREKSSSSPRGLSRVSVPLKRWYLPRSRFGEVTERRTPDVVHLHNLFSPANNRIASLVSAPYVVTTHGACSPEQLAFRRTRKALWRVLFDRRLLVEAATTVALTQAEVAEIERFALGARIAVIPNGVNAAPDVESRRFRERLGIGDQPLLVYVGRLDIEHKRIDETISAVAQAPPWHLAVIGPDWRGSRQSLEALVLSRGASSRIHLLGPMEGRSLHEAYAAADALILQSRWEGFPMVLLEAASHGTPAIVSREVERRVDLVRSGAAVEVTIRDLPHFLSTRPAEVRTRLADMRERAQAFAQQHTWPAVAAAYETVFASAASRRGPTTQAP